MKTNYKKWLFTYKLLHIPFWLLVWSSTFFVYYVSKDPLLPQICNASAVVITSMAPFYLTAHWLIPKFLYTSKYFVFTVALTLLVLVSGFMMMISARGA